MRVINEEDIRLETDTVVAIGSFDGIHVGHQRLIDTVVAQSNKLGLPSLIFTFSNHPSRVLSHRTPVKKLITNEQKIDIFNKSHVDFLYLKKFTTDFLKLTPEEFIKQVLVEQIRAKIIVVGFNFRFGSRGAGDVNTLLQYSEVYGYKVVVIPPIKFEEVLVSSTVIREKIAAGDMECVTKLLTRPFGIVGKVVKGKQIGRTIGFPTINLQYDEDNVTPQIGVYISKVSFNNIIYNGVTNVGYNPTFEGNALTVETFIFDFNQEIYGSIVEVQFLKRIRGEIKFQTIQELIQQLQKDVIVAKGYFGN